MIFSASSPLSVIITPSSLDETRVTVLFQRYLRRSFKRGGLKSGIPLLKSSIGTTASLVILSMGLLLLIACSGSNGDDGSGFTGVEVIVSPTAGEVVEVAESGVSGGPRSGGVLVLDTGHCEVWDPAIDTDRTGNLSLRLVSEIHAGLTKIVEAPELRLEPDLAESFEVSNDGLVYEFTLRKDLKFSDGSLLTSSDVKWSWERALRKSTGQSRANGVLGVVQGASAVASGDSDELMGVEIADERRFNVTLDSPRPDFPMLLSDTVAAVLKHDNVADWDDVWENDDSGGVSQPGRLARSIMPVGAGPFVLTDYANPLTTIEARGGENRCVVERNEYYWDRPAYLDAVIARVYPDMWVDDEGTRTRQKVNLDAGELDLGIADRDLDDGSDFGVSGAKVERFYIAPITFFLTFNPAHPPLDDVNFRRALVKSADPVWRRNPDREVSNTNRLAPASVAPVNSAVSGFDADLPTAKEDLEKSAYSATIDELDLSIHVIFADLLDNYHSTIFDVWRDELGVDVDIREFDTSSDEVPFWPLLEDVQITEVRYSFVEPLPDGVLREFSKAFGDENKSPEFAEIDRTLLDAESELDAAARQGKYEDIEQHILDQALALPILALDTYQQLVVQPWVHDLHYPRYHGSVFHNVWLDDTAPARELR